MESSTRIAVNTIAQYVRTIINSLLALYSTRIVLSALGDVDYGIYSLVAGVVAMLSFFTTALSQTTQRFLSFFQGKGEYVRLTRIFNNSLIIHLTIGILFVIVLELLSFVVFKHLLNIPIERINVAQSLYHAVVISLLVSFTAAPYYALLISHENIVYTSVVSVVDGILKVGVAVILTKITYDRLIFYGYCLVLIQCFNYLAWVVYSKIRYKECIIFPSIKLFCIADIKKLIGFAGWNTYITGCYIIRTQGVSVLVNRFMGAAVNAAYGISIQVQALVMTISQAVSNAIRPQTIKAEGENNRSKMLFLATVESKIAFYLFSAFAVPVLFEMPAILSVWIKDVPDYSVQFCSMMLIASLFDMWSIGLSTAFSASGHLKKYSLFVQTVKIMTIPVVWLNFRLNCGITGVCIVFILFELLCSFLRILLSGKELGVNLNAYMKDFVFRSFQILLLHACICFCIVHFLDFPYRFLVTIPVSVIIYAFIIYIYGMNNTEKEYILKAKERIIRKIR